MRPSLPILLALSTSLLLACDPEQDLGNNNPSAGSSGASGTAGQSGIAGTSGQPGTAGSSGTSGQAGTAGSPPTGGTAGTAGTTAGTSGDGGTGGNAGEAGSSTGGTSAAGGTSTTGGTGGTSGTAGTDSTGGTAGASAGASGSAGSAGNPDVILACPPATKVGTLAPVPFASGALGYAWDFRFGQQHRYLLEDPWVDISPSAGGPPTGSLTLQLNQGYQAMALLPGVAVIPPAWQSSDKLSTYYVKETDETILALRTKVNSYSMGQAAPGLIVAGTDVYWSLRVPARVVEAPLGGSGTERVIAQYDEASGLVPLGLGVDDAYVYWTIGKPTSNQSFESGPQNNKVFRALRHDPGAAPEELASDSSPLDTLLVGVDALHVGIARATGGTGASVAHLPKSGGPLQTWGEGFTSFRVGRMAELDGFIYYTEHGNGDCAGRLLRYDPESKSQLFKQPEVLADGMYFPMNLVAHAGKLYFTTAADFTKASTSGGLFAYEPPAVATCQPCASVYTSGATGPVCADSEQTFTGMLVCGLDQCPGSCSTLPQPGTPLPTACRTCLQSKCAPEVSACQADTAP